MEDILELKFADDETLNQLSLSRKKDPDYTPYIMMRTIKIIFVVHNLHSVATFIDHFYIFKTAG